jgi:hydrogenase maturation protein HypF
LLRRDLTLAQPYPLMRVQAPDRPDVLDFRLAVRGIAADLAAAVDLETVSRRFHSTVVSMVVEQCQAVREETGVEQVALSGGVFLNEFVQVNCLVELNRSGFTTFVHKHVPTNDGGISLGQIVVADARITSGTR